jgi:hypothetical protein
MDGIRRRWRRGRRKEAGPPDRKKRINHVARFHFRAEADSFLFFLWLHLLGCDMFHEKEAIRDMRRGNHAVRAANEMLQPGCSKFFSVESLIGSSATAETLASASAAAAAMGSTAAP